MLPAQGVHRVRVRALRVLIIGTGDELDSRSRPGRVPVPDSISPLLPALATGVGSVRWVVVSALMTWHEYGHPILARLAGARLLLPKKIRLSRRITSHHPMDSIFHFRVQGRSARATRYRVRLYSELAKADAYGILPRHRSLRSGAMVAARPLQRAA